LKVSIPPMQQSISWLYSEELEDADRHSFYLGKKVAFVYRAQREVRGSKIRVIWGKVTRPHGMY
jgi:large subunit ribosomal protein L35Ae